MPASPRIRVKQVHHAYLDALYVCDYFRTVKKSRVKWTRPLDLLIAFGGSGSGAVGFIGILGKVGWLAWVCGPLAVVSSGLAIARKVYEWDKEVDQADRMIDAYGKLSVEYRNLIDELNASQAWSELLSRKASALRNRRVAVAPAKFPGLPDRVEEAIEAGIKKRIDRRSWWLPQE